MYIIGVLYPATLTHTQSTHTALTLEVSRDESYEYKIELMIYGSE